MREELHRLIETYDLLDIWRIHNPDSKKFTWRKVNPLVQSRLDYWLIGVDVSYNISKCSIKPSIKTDHSLLSLKLINTENNKRGPGLWKFNASLLCDLDFVGYMKGMIELQSTNYGNVTDKSLKWELLKMEMRDAIIAYSKTQAYYRKEYENQLNLKLKKIDELLEQNVTNALLAELMTVNNEIKNINAIKTEGCRIRSKAMFIEHNERGSKLFIGLERRNSNIKNITRLKTEQGHEIIEEKKILNELSSFYETLYTAKTLDEDSANMLYL